MVRTIVAGCQFDDRNPPAVPALASCSSPDCVSALPPPPLSSFSNHSFFVDHCYSIPIPNVNHYPIPSRFPLYTARHEPCLPMRHMTPSSAKMPRSYNPPRVTAPRSRPSTNRNTMVWRREIRRRRSSGCGYSLPSSPSCSPWKWV